MAITQFGISVGTIGTIAGIGTPGYSGDGNSAAGAALNEPKAVVVDRHGNLYIADAENHAIRRVEMKSGTITSIAGSFGRPIVAGEKDAPVRSSSGPRAAPPLEDPFEDPLYESLQPERFVQRSDLSGTVRFLVGSAPRGDHFRGDGGPASAATLNFPSALALDAENNL